MSNSTCAHHMAKARIDNRLSQRLCHLKLGWVSDSARAVPVVNRDRAADKHELQILSSQAPRSHGFARPRIVCGKFRDQQPTGQGARDEMDTKHRSSQRIHVCAETRIPMHTCRLLAGSGMLKRRRGAVRGVCLGKQPSNIVIARSRGFQPPDCASHNKRDIGGLCRALVSSSGLGTTWARTCMDPIMPDPGLR